MENDPDRPSFLRWLLLHVTPALIMLAAGIGIAITVVGLLKKDPGLKEPVRILPVVETIEAKPSSIVIEVQSQGTVEARTQTNLVAEVSGRVENISPALYAGGFFRKGDVLATIDDTDYKANLAAAKSRYAEAQLAHEQERAASAQALEDWKAVGNSGQPSDLVLRKPQLERAKANLEAAEASVLSAQKDLERTSVKAPYDGRVQKKFIDVGQFANARTSQIASIYSVDTAEVRLAIPLSDTRLIDVPETYRDAGPQSAKPQVTIESDYGGNVYRWNGIIDRSEGTVDPQTRLLNLVAKIPDPYRRDPNDEKPPLKIGSFVTATIKGKTLEDAYEIPRKALHEDDTVYVVTPDRKLQVRKVDVYQKTTENAILTAGLQPGELLCLTPLQYVVDGMEVQIDGEESSKELAASNEEAIADQNL